MVDGDAACVARAAAYRTRKAALRAAGQAAATTDRLRDDAVGIGAHGRQVSVKGHRYAAGAAGVERSRQKPGRIGGDQLCRVAQDAAAVGDGLRHDAVRARAVRVQGVLQVQVHRTAIGIAPAQDRGAHAGRGAGRNDAPAAAD
ncbi:hypothetical protein D3C72_1327730 [compost metagenome]